MREEVLISVEVDRDDQDFQQLAQLKTTLSGIKEEQNKLNQAFKAGKITRQEHSQEIVRLEANYKKINATYQETQRKVTGLKAPFADLKSAVADNAKQISVAGVSLTSFANPVTGTIALLGGLFKAYASTTTGAKDLEFAQSLVSLQFGMVTEKLSRMVSGGEDGGGLFSSLALRLNRGSQALREFYKSLGITNSILVGDDVSGKVEELAFQLQKLDDLTRTKTRTQGDIAARIEENAELKSQIDRTTDLNEKLRLQDQIVDNLKTNQAELNKVNNESLAIREDIFAADDRNEEKEAARDEAKKTAERESARLERLIQAEERARTTIIETTQKQTKALRELNAEQERSANIARLAREREGLKGFEGFAEKVDEAAAPINLQTKATNSLAEATAHLGELIDANKDKQEKSDESFEKGATQKGQLIQSIIQQSAQAFQQQMQAADDFAKGLLKGFLVSSLRALKTFFQFEIAAKALASPESVATFGIAGAIKTAILTGLLEVAFGAAESALTAFAGGGKVQDWHGIPINRGNGDNRLVTVRAGDEAILNKQQIDRLGGPSALAAAGVPGYSSSRTAFATGGFLSPQGISQSQLNQLASIVNRQQVAVIIEQVEAKMEQRAQIREQATL